MRFAGFIGPSYTSQSVNVDCQRTVNLYPEINALGTGKEREVAALMPTPGLRLLFTLVSSPIRGMFTASNGEFYIVADRKLYSVSAQYEAVEIGTLNTSTGRVSIADNGTYLFIVDGTYGYTWNMETDTFAVVTDPAFPGASQVAFIDGYFVFVKAGSPQFFISGLNDVTFDALDVATAEGDPDTLVGLTVSNQNLFLFGSRSTEVYYDSGDADFPFTRMQGAVLDFGCIAPHSIARIGGSIFWLGGDSHGSGIVYQMAGVQSKRVSTSAIEAVIRGLTTDERAEATAYTYQQGGHMYYCLNIPSTNSTWVYDMTTEFWHERQYLGLWHLERHRAEFHVVAHGLNVVADYETGDVYALDPDVYTDNGNSIPRIRTAPHITKGLTLLRHNSFLLDMETGVGDGSLGQGGDPQVMLSYSDDGGHTWSPERTASAGAMGERKKRVKVRRLGMSRDRVYQVKITDPVKVVLIGAELEVEEGTA
jgi:hypothetical protein